MKSHREMFEALLAGETLKNSSNKREIKLIDGILYSNRQNEPGNFYQLKNVLGCMLAAEEFEIKPKTINININGFDVPEPIRSREDMDSAIYFIPLLHGNLNAKLQCTYIDDGEKAIKLGIAHKTKEAAIAHAKALLSFTNHK